jgi:hypothetical protein
MARSFRHISIVGTTLAESEKKDKRIANRRERSRINQILHIAINASEDELEWLVLPHKRELSNVWSFDKDGKHYVSKESAYYKQALRK